MLYAIIAAIILIGDQWLKYWVTVNITLSTGEAALIPGVVKLVNIHNSGAAFGLLGDAAYARWLFLGIAALFIIVIVVVLAKHLFKSRFANWCAVMALAGAVGNCIDRALYGKHAQRMMKTDVKEVENGYEVDIDLPGFKKDEITLELKDGYLTISAQKAIEKDNEKHGRMLRQERYAGMMQRSFYVGEHITEEDVKASYESGVLHLVIPKKDAPKMPEKKVIQIEG